MIDGSRAAVNAALWAVDEAIDRGVPLRLVHVVHVEESQAAPAQDVGLEIEYAEAALRAACAAVDATGKSVDVESAVLRGAASTALIDESRRAAMVCVGSVGIGRVARMLLGSTAAALANQAYCPVAVIRTRAESPTPDTGAIVVVVDDSADNDAVVQRGFAEAVLRHAPLIPVGVWRWGIDEDLDDHLDRRLESWLDRYPDVSVQSFVAPEGVVEFVASSEEPIQLAVVGSTDAGKIMRLVGPVAGTSIFDHAECSVLVVRQ